MCYWKQWRYGWTLATQTGMTNQWLKDPCLQQAGRASVCQRAVGEHSLPDYGPVNSVNRPVRLPAAGRDPHAGWCGGWGTKTPGYPIIFFALSYICLTYLKGDQYRRY